MLKNLRSYARFGAGLHKFVRHPPDAGRAGAVVQENLANRERNFLRIVEHGVYDNPRSPYLALLRHAGYSLRDVRQLVETAGLDPALKALRDAGVYVTFEEFKGRTPIVRGSLTIPVSAKDFDNPRLRAHYEGETSGSTGAGTRVSMDLDHLSATLDQLSLYMGIVKDVHVPWAVWFPPLPATSGLASMLLGACLGLRIEHWFTPVTSADMHIPLKYRLATRYARLMARLYGVRIPAPEPVSIGEAARVARWARAAIDLHGGCIVVTYVSLAVRVALAAKELGLDLAGCRFLGTGEPATPAKVAAIRAAGARWTPTYAFTEGGLVALACRNPLGDNDLHVMKDAWAVLQSPVEVPGSTLLVNAFCFTSLFPTTPRIMLNVELDDYGVLETRDCGCPMQAAGYDQHVRDIYSYRKLTGEGMTLVGSTMLRILEEILPAKHGGSALDYQLMEEEDERGLTRLTIVISPRVGLLDESAVIETVLDEVARDSAGAELARAMWKDAGTLRIRRQDPAWSTLGKLMSLRPAKRNAGILYGDARDEAGVA